MKLMITHADETRLRGLGYSADDIRKMKPEEAEAILDAEIRNAPLADQTLEVAALTTSNENPQKIYKYPDIHQVQKYYPDASEDGVKHLLDILPDAYKAWSLKKPGQWGPGFIKNYIHKSVDTTGKYLKGIHLSGTKEWKGIEVPYRPRAKPPTSESSKKRRKQRK